MSQQTVAVEVNRDTQVSGIFECPEDAIACLVLAHGAGAGMNHPFMISMASGLKERGIATLRYQFPFAERGSRRPDPAPICHATVRAAALQALRHTAALPLFAGGKSFGGRMTSQTQAEMALEQVRGLVFLGFPLHPAGRPGVARADHLSKVKIPMQFLQGTRDALADPTLMTPLCMKLGRNVTLRYLQDADHSFHVRASSGRNDVQLQAEMLDELADWISAH